MSDIEKQVKHNGMQALFATPVFLSEIIDNSLLDSVTNSILKLKKSNCGYARYGSWVTNDNLHTLPEFEELTRVLLHEAGRALDTLTVKRNSHYITCMWSNIAPVGSSHNEHIHSNSMYSGVLYLRMPKGSATTIFSDPRPAVSVFRPDYENPNPFFLGARWSITQDRGGLIIFPSWLPHSVEPVPVIDVNTEERITLSFNIMIRSKVEIDTAGIEFK
jgi:uncharacterized protein (TIGR02466 family)